MCASSGRGRGAGTAGLAEPRDARISRTIRSRRSDPAARCLSTWWPEGPHLAAGRTSRPTAPWSSDEAACIPRSVQPLGRETLECVVADPETARAAAARRPAARLVRRHAELPRRAAAVVAVRLRRAPAVDPLTGRPGRPRAAVTAVCFVLPDEPGDYVLEGQITFADERGKAMYHWGPTIAA